MSSNILASCVAELLALNAHQRHEALSNLSRYKGLTQPEKPMYYTGYTAPVAPAVPVAPVRSDHGFQSNKFTSVSRRGSVASTWAGGSSADSSVDFSDAASEASDPTVPEAVAEAVLRGSDFLKCEEPPRSTLKIANIPRRCGKEELLAAIHDAGFADAYDFFYLPLGPQSKKNHGYAFINFKSNEIADGFSQVFVGYPIRAKLLEVAPAPLQGLQQNIEHFSKTQAVKGGWMPNVVLRV